MHARELEDDDLISASGKLTFDAGANVSARAEETCTDAFFSAAILLQRDLHRLTLHLRVVLKEQVAAVGPTDLRWITVRLAAIRIDFGDRFRMGAQGFRGTELLRAGDGSYLSLDVWGTREDFDAFMAAHGEDYAALDRSTESWTRSEHRIGDYEVLN